MNLPEFNLTKANRIQTLLLIVSLIIWPVVGSVLWWFDYSKNFILILTAFAMVITLFSFIAYVLIRRKKNKSKEVDPQHYRIKQHKKSFTERFKKVFNPHKTRNQFKNCYEQPLYLFLSQNLSADQILIAQMGYEFYQDDHFDSENEFPMHFWVAEHSMIIAVHLGGQYEADYLEILSDCLKKRRPRQAVNGILLATEAALLMGGDDEVLQSADDIKAKIKILNNQFGLNLPIYNIITHIGQIHDCCHLFSSLTEKKQNAVFGATSPVRKNNSINAQWYDREFDTLITQLFSAAGDTLKSQSNTVTCNAISASPFQFGLIKQRLWLFFQRLYLINSLTDHLNFRGFYFTHSGTEAKQIDPLANIANDLLSNSRFKQSYQVSASKAFFVQNIMSQVILREKDLAGVNNQKESMLRFAQAAYVLLCAILSVSSLTIVKLNIDYIEVRDRQANKLLAQYKEAVQASPYRLDNVSENISNLYYLSRIYRLYHKPDPWYWLEFMSDKDTEEEIKTAYLDALQNVLIPSMENAIETDLYLHAGMQDEVQTLNLLNNYALLFNSDRTNISQLYNYFISNLSFLNRSNSFSPALFETLLGDVFTHKLVATNEDINLTHLAESVIKKVSIESLLYQYIFKSNNFSKTVDIRGELDTHFSKVFSFSPDYDGYLVPFLYTPAGFNKLDLSVNSPELRNALQAYEGIIGSSHNESELYRISQSLRQLYQNDYIGFWNDFADNINIHTAMDTETLDRNLTALTATSDNPLILLYSTISKYTSVNVDSTSSVGGDENFLQPYQDREQSAEIISNAFSSYHNQLANLDGTPPKINNVIAQFESIDKWLAQFFSSDNPQELAFSILTSDVKESTPVTSFVEPINSPPMTIEIINTIQKQSNALVLSLAHGHLNEVWKADVFDVYQNTIAAYYPFNKTSSVDAAIDDVTDFFKEGGVMDNFYNLTFNKLVTSGQRSFLSGLLPKTGLPIDPYIRVMIDKAEQIRNTLFIRNPQQVSLEFQIKVAEMSPDLTEFSIVDQQPVFTYRHGPQLWTEKVWAPQAIDNSSLSFRLQTQSALVVGSQYEGSWAWFKLIEPRVTSIQSQNTFVGFEHNGEKVVLNVKSQGQLNPFAPDFFSSFRLPSRIRSFRGGGLSLTH